jgi:glutathione S-transferase
MAVIDRLDLEVEYKDISADETLATELESLGGKRQVPYLIDTEANVSLYESDDIVTHLQRTYGQPAATTRPRVHVGGSTCVSCEG